jgi:AbrB family looped-hinge helix DNA binding protein
MRFLIKVQKGGRITIPAPIRGLLNLQTGDLLEITLSGGKLIIIPINTIAPTPDWLKDIGSEAKRKGLNKVSMRQIDAEIAAARRERHQRTDVDTPTKAEAAAIRKGRAAYKHGDNLTLNQLQNKPGTARHQPPKKGTRKAS